VWYACAVEQPPVPYVRRLAAALVMDGLLLAFLLATWLAAQAVSDLLL
jgi:hypothetical protein